MKLQVVSGKFKCTRKETFEKVQCPLNNNFTAGSTTAAVLSAQIVFNDITCFGNGFAI